ncbi:soluble NSF attachment protein [Chytriomyces sp. MP71]|nr:soluble NSF attachment protein [Chytriomyces sp. MP71]
MSVQQGMDLMNQAAKFMDKKSWLGKSTPDLDSARPLYEQAALQFKNAKATDYAVDAYLKSADIYKRQDALYLSAKQIETAALLLEKNKNFVEAAKLFKQASDQFVMYGSGEKGAEVLEKAARGLETVNFDEALYYYTEACALYDVEDKPRSGIDTYGRFISFLVRSRRWPQAIEYSERLLGLNRKLDMRINFFKQALTTVILVLLSGDSVEAKKRLVSFEEYPGFYDSEEGRISGGLVECFENYDDVELANILKNQTIRYLDNEIAKAAQTLRIPGSGKTVAPQNPIGGYAQQQFAPPLQQSSPRPVTNQQPGFMPGSGGIPNQGYVSPSGSNPQLSPRSARSASQTNLLPARSGSQTNFMPPPNMNTRIQPSASFGSGSVPEQQGYYPVHQPQAGVAYGGQPHNLVDDDDDLC